MQDAICHLTCHNRPQCCHGVENPVFSEQLKPTSQRSVSQGFYPVARTYSLFKPAIVRLLVCQGAIPSMALATNSDSTAPYPHMVLSSGLSS